MSEAHARQIQAQFGRNAAAYVTSAGHAGGEDLERLLAWGRARRPVRVLDVATGGGHTALAFAGIARRVTAYDLAAAMPGAARRFIAGRHATNVDFVAGDVQALPFRESSFDVVTCRIAPHHFADVAGALRQVARALRPGGSFLLQDILGHDDRDANAFILEVERRRDPTHIRAYRAAEWKAFLRGAGLTVIDEAMLSRMRGWSEWAARAQMSAEAREALERFVRQAPAACRAAFDFRLTGDAIESFTDRMILLRADKD